MLIGLAGGLAVGTICEIANYVTSVKKEHNYLDMVAENSVRELIQIKEGGTANGIQ